MPRIGQDVSINAAGDALGGEAQWSESQLTDYLTQQYRANPGMQIPTGFKLSNGKIITDKTFFQRHSWIVPLLFGAGGAAAGVATGAIDLGALAAGGPAAASTTIGSTATGTGAAAGTGGTLAATSTVPATGALATGSVASGAVPAATAAGTGGGVASTLGSIGWANIISGGTQAAGAYLQSRANNKATDAEAKAAKDALDFLKARDARDYADQAPYRSLGANSANTLAAIMGQGTNNAPPNPLPATPNAIPPGQPFPSSWVPGSPFAPGGAQSVVMVAPNGEEKAVPANEVQHWISLKARVKGAAPAAPAMPPPAQGRDLGSVIGGGI